jgi:Spy/CpxP family protein refolding chaperone
MSGKIKAVILLLVMYGLGAASGIAWQRYCFHRFPSHHVMFADRRLKRLTSQLSLTPEQESAMRDILQKAHERAIQVNEEVSWDLADIHKDTVKAIEKILTPVQLAKFEKMHQKFHDEHKHIPTDDFDEPAATTQKAGP